jgi:hypothetical protein
VAAGEVVLVGVVCACASANHPVVAKAAATKLSET